MIAIEILKKLNTILGDSLNNLHEDNYGALIVDPLYEAQKKNLFPEHACDNGATKAVIILKGEPYVIKIPFSCRYEASCFEDKVHDYQQEHKELSYSQCIYEIEKITSEEDFLYEYEMAFSERFDESILSKYEHLLTGSDYCALEMCYYLKAAEEGLSDYFAEEELLGYIGSTPVYIQQRVTPFYSHYETIESDEYSSDRGVTTRKKCKEMECFCFNETWIADFFDAYGEKEFKRLSGFLDKFDIGDLRCANIGYIDGRPILFDYAGYNEW